MISACTPMWGCAMQAASYGGLVLLAVALTVWLVAKVDVETNADRVFMGLLVVSMLVMALSCAIGAVTALMRMFL